MADGRRLLVLADHYRPAVRAGGPVQSLSNLVRALHDEGVDVSLVCRDRDVADRQPLPGVASGRWTPLPEARVFYLRTSSPREWLRLIRHLRQEPPPRTLYLNSLFSPSYTLLPLLLRAVGLVRAERLVLAPRGECAPGALGLKRWKKVPVLTLLRRSGVLRRAVLHVTGEPERADVTAALGVGQDARLVVLPNLSRAPVATRPRAGWSGSTRRLLCVGRVSPMKNTLVLLRALAQVAEPVHLDVVGPQDDPGYLSRCRSALDEMPERHAVRLVGPVSPEEVRRRLADADLFVLPTAGENFGHAIAEALAAGCPVVVSDRTPWSSPVARAGAGIVLDGTGEDAVTRGLTAALSWDDDALARASRAALDVAASARADAPATAAYVEALLGGAP